MSEENNTAWVSVEKALNAARDAHTSLQEHLDDYRKKNLVYQAQMAHYRKRRKQLA